MRLEERDDGRVAFVFCDRQWRPSALFRFVDRRASVQQEPRRVDVAVLAGDVQQQPRRVDVGRQIAPTTWVAGKATSLLKGIVATMNQLHLLVSYDLEFIT